MDINTERTNATILLFQDTDDFVPIKGASLEMQNYNQIIKFPSSSGIYRAGSKMEENEQCSEFKKYYYSRKNLDIIQKYIKNMVLSKGYIISDQDEASIIQVMFNAYTMYSCKPLDPKKFATEISKLDNIVIKKIVDHIMVSIDKHFVYLRQFNEDHKNTLELPEYTTKSESISNTRNV